MADGAIAEGPGRPIISPIPALHLHYGHRLLLELGRQGPIPLGVLLNEADDVEQLFKGERPHRRPYERAQQLMRYAQELGLVRHEGGELRLTREGEAYVAAGDPSDVFATTEAQRALLVEQLQRGVRSGGGVATGVALLLQILEDRPAGSWESTADLGMELGRRGGMTRWRERRTFEAQAERFLALARDAGLVSDFGAPNRDGRELAGELAWTLARSAGSTPPAAPAAGRTLAVARTSAIHLVLKWSARLAPDTIERHVEVEREHGAVWWGRVSRPGVTGLSRRWVEQLRAQIAAGVPTSVFLRGVTTWHGRLLAITTDRAEVEEELVPAYYDPATHHSLWVKLTDLQEVEPSEITSGYVLAQRGTPVTPGALGNQTPLILRGPPRQPAAPAPPAVAREAGPAPPRDGAAGPPRPPPRPPLRRAVPTRPLDVATLRRAAARHELDLEDDVYAHVVAVLRSGKHLILTGPPGTAKTTLATAVAEAAQEVGMCLGHVPTTATADWTTNETIGGLRPTEDGPLAFEEGHFVTAIADDRWLVIDELNRSQFDRAFGQLFTVLSGHRVVLPYRRNGGEAPLALVPHGDRGVRDGLDVVPISPTWRIVATMNVFDKTLLFDMSFALMRRFGFVEVGCPRDETFELLIDRCADDARAAALSKRLLPLRRYKDVGPAVFMDVAHFLRERIALAPSAVDEQLLFEAFYSYLLPQFEGIQGRAGGQLHDDVAQLVGPERRARLRTTLRTVLGLELTDDAASELSEADGARSPDAA